MKLLILGASGGSGKEITLLALAKGIETKAMVRSPRKLNLQHRNLEIVQGDILSEHSISEALKNIDTVIWAIGHENKAKAKKTMALDICSRGTAYLIKAMKEKNINCLIAISSWGVGNESLKRTPWFFRNFIFRYILNKEFEDKQKQEEIIISSDLDYTIVRPSRLTGGNNSANLKVEYKLRYNHFSHTPRKALSNFIINELNDKNFIRKTVEITC